MSNEPRTLQKIGKLERALSAISKMIQAGWMDDVSPETRENICRVLTNAHRAIRYAKLTGDSWVSALAVGSELVCAELVIRKAIQDKTRNVIEDESMDLNVNLRFLDPDELAEE